MTDDLCFIALAVCWLFCMAMLLLRAVHMFQLNSYKPYVQRKWVAENIFEILIKTVWVALTVPALLEWKSAGMLISAGIYVVVGLLNLPKKAKKPLVATARVKRLFFTLAVICLAVLALAWFDTRHRPDVMVLAAFVALASPYLVLLANAINSPVEKLINLHYINDAKKRLAGMPSLRVVGVTGSYGKTSMKMILSAMLAERYGVLPTPDSYNTTLGVVRTIRERMRPTDEIFVCEMGARNPGDVKEICDIVRPTAGIITSVGPQHLESFKTVENVLKTKLELADSLPEGGLLLVNADCEYLRGREGAVGYGIDAGDWRASDIKTGTTGSEFTLTGPDGVSARIRTRLIGRHNVLNVTGAAAAAYLLGVPLKDIAAAAARLDPVPHRLQLLGGAGRWIIDDAYNSNPAGAEAALEALSAFDAARILVTPGMVELGTKQYELNRAFGEQAARAADFVALVGEKQTRPILDGLLAAGMPEDKIKVCATLEEAMQAADGFDAGGRGRVILLENDLPDNY